VKKYENYIEKHDPATKNSGLFFFNSVGLARPEIVRHKKRLAARYAPPSQAKTLLLLPQTRRKPFHKSQALMDIARKLDMCENWKKLHVCFYGSPFSVVPVELDEVYPLSQHEAALLSDSETAKTVATDLSDYISRTTYERVVLLNDPEKWGKSFLTACKKTCVKKKIKFRNINAGEDQQRKLADCLKDALVGDTNKP
jgi:7-cyano-7-deazaguanine tRNA-ribosyltransferase